MKKNIVLLFAICALPLLHVSCDDDETADNGSGRFLVGLRTIGSNDESSDYLLMHDDLMTGEINSTGKGAEQTGWCYYGKSGSTYFTFNYTQNECIGYSFENGTLTEKDRFVFERMDCINPGGDENTVVAIGAPWGGGSFNCSIQLVDVADVSIKATKLHPIYETYFEGEQLNAWPTASYVENGKLFVAFYTLFGESENWDTPVTDTAYVSVFTYPGLEYIKTFKDTRTSPIGYYGSQPCILEDEKGDHYTISTSSYAAGFTQVTKPSGILRIKAGADQFDEDYFFNVEEASGYKLLNAAYAGNGKAVGRVVVSETKDSQWDAFYGDDVLICKAVVLDLVNKTVTTVAEVPLHLGQWQTPLFAEDGKVYMSVNDGTDAYIYQIDAATGKGVKGARIAGKELQGIFD